MQKATCCKAKDGISQHEKRIKQHQNRDKATQQTENNAENAMKTGTNATADKEHRNTVENPVDNHVENRWKNMWISTRHADTTLYTCISTPLYRQNKQVFNR